MMADHHYTFFGVTKMSQEMENNDGLMLHAEGAWHSMGTIVSTAPTPKEALPIAKLDWQVEQLPLYAMDMASDPPSRIVIDSHVLNVRSDDKGKLGIVGKDYQPFQNADLADFCEQLLLDNVVRCETAGSIRGGQKVWFLLKGQPFDVRQEDTVVPYILVSNGHDGGTALRITPTTIRVVCSNTLHMVIPRYESEKGKSTFRSAAYAVTHTGDLKSKVQAAREALQRFGKATETTRGIITALSAKEVNSEEFKAFFLEAYARDFGQINLNPVTDKEVRHKEKAIKAFRQVERRFETEKVIAGTTLWNAMNSYTGWVQNDRSVNLSQERKTSMKLFGVDADRSSSAFEQAMALVV
jgi:phage/plasmid-like protein (TIGR03299 family)